MPAVSTVYLYYDNPRMLWAQMECWNTYKGVLRKLPEVIVVDDGSPRTSAAEVVKAGQCRLAIKVFRIREDIRWNFSGARNLGCSQARGWTYISDIDTMLFAEDAKALFENERLDKKLHYMPRRVYLPELKPAESANSNLLFHRELFDKVGWFDEDYAGHYGKEESDFLARLERLSRLVVRQDAAVHVVPSQTVPDARTAGPRNSRHNDGLFLKKQRLGFPAPQNPLRFHWKRAL